MSRLLALTVMILLSGCIQSKEENSANESKLIETIYPKYANGFYIHYYEGKKELVVTKPFKGATDTLIYSYSESDHVDIDVPGPVNRLIVTSTTHLAFLDLLGIPEKLVAFPGTHYISSKRIRERVESGAIEDLGSEKELNIEKVINASPDLVVSYLLTADLGNLRKLTEAGIPVVLNAEYLEVTPLGKAEWIKYMAAFFDLEKKADSIFSKIESEYLRARNLANGVTIKPTVLSGIVYGDTWFMPGGESWAAIFLKDAGADFLWSDVPQAGSLELSFESVFEKAHAADYWIGVASYTSLDALEAQDQRYARFKAFEDGNVYTYMNKLNEPGGNDFFETGTARPDLILKDLIRILHSELLPNHQLYFYSRLQ